MPRRKVRRLSQFSVVELMEARVLYSGTAPTITSAVLGPTTGKIDNIVTLSLDPSVPLNPSTVNTKSVLIFTAGADKVLGTKDDVLDKSTIVSYSQGANVITIDTFLPADTPYIVDVLGSVVTGVNGVALDGEFNGANTASGDGTPGGDYVFQTQPGEAVFNTVEGEIDVTLFSTIAPKTVANFASYAEKGDWNDTFFHRSVPGFVIQGGGFNVNIKKDQIGAVPVMAPVEGEPDLSNLPGTIAMALTDFSDGSTDPNSGTNQWFFNLADNSSDLDGAFTVFGTLANVSSQTTVNNIAGLETLDLSNGNSNSPFSEVPVVNYSSGNVDPATNLVLVSGINILTVPTALSSSSVPTAQITSKLPSLIYTGVPNSSGAKNASSVTVTLTNPGIALSADATVTLYASNTPDSVGSAAQIVSLPAQQISLLPGKAMTFTLPLTTVPSSITTGNAASSFYLVAQISGVGSTPILVSSATKVTFQAPVIDLTTKITKVPSLAVSGKTATFSVQVINNGNIPAVGPVSILLGGSIDANPGDAINFGSAITENVNLAAGGTQTFNVTVTIPSNLPADNYFIIATLTDTSFGVDTDSADKVFVNTPFTMAVVP